jgi:hypothetical protein
VLLLQKYDQTDQNKDRIVALDLRTRTEQDFLGEQDKPLYHPFFSWDDRWVVFKKLQSLAGHAQILIAPVRHGAAAGQAEWIAVTDGRNHDDKPQFSGSAAWPKAVTVFPAAITIQVIWARSPFTAGSWGIRGVRRRNAMELFTLGIDLGKTTFHILGMNQRGEVVVRKCFLACPAVALHREPEDRVDRHGACGGSHFLGRALREQAMIVEITVPGEKYSGPAGRSRIAGNPGAILRKD